MKKPSLKSMRPFLSVAVLLLVPAGWPPLFATENVPHAPFAQWAEVPGKGNLITRLTYQESEAYYIWDPKRRYNVDRRAKGEHYGIDINQGYLTLQYGLTERWAADLSVGYTTAGWRHFSDDGSPESTSGLMDISFGFRYQIFKEDKAESDWRPTLTFRAGAVMPGTFDQYFAFAPGTASTAIEPELLVRKHFGWQGFGVYGDALFRWNHTSANDLYIIAAGFFQKIQRWELNAGYRRVGSVDGDDIKYDPSAPSQIYYPRAVAETSDSFEAGFNYMTRKRQVKWGFQTSTVFAGANTDKKFWLGAYVEIPFQLGKSEAP